jgi:hypothetical protein
MRRLADLIEASADRFATLESTDNGKVGRLSARRFQCRDWRLFVRPTIFADAGNDMKLGTIVRGAMYLW